MAGLMNPKGKRKTSDISDQFTTPEDQVKTGKVLASVSRSEPDAVERGERGMTERERELRLNMGKDAARNLVEGTIRGNEEKAAEADEPNVSPQEQQEYNQFVANGMKLMYQPEGLNTVVSSLMGAGTPVEGLAATLVMLVKRLEDSATQNGQTINPDVMYQGSIELLEQLGEMQKEAGVHDPSEEELGDALLLALDQYREMKTAEGTLDSDAIGAEFEMLRQAEQDGSLEEILPGITEYSQNAQQPPQGGEQ